MVKKSSKKEKDSTPITVPEPPEQFVRLPTRWVTVHFSLMGFSALDGEVRLPPTATVHQVESKIISHHGGSISRLSLWKDRIEPSCVIRDFSQSLRDVFGLDNASPRTLAHGRKQATAPSPAQVAPGFPSSEVEDHHVLVFYDYRAHDCDCPLLLRSPRYPKMYDEKPPSTQPGEKLDATKKS